MKSEFGDFFNHDDEAEDYDSHVLNEEDPIRRGYQALQDWIGHYASSHHFGSESPEHTLQILELGCGTGNTTALLPRSKIIYAVDISERMLSIARQKLKDHHEIQWIQQDLLEFVLQDSCPQVHILASCYALHHLTPAEKITFLRRLPQILHPKGQLLLGDLMFRDTTSEKQLREDYPQLSESFDEEFFWQLNQACEQLEQLDFEVSTQRFSDLSWGLRAQAP